MDADEFDDGAPIGAEDGVEFSDDDLMDDDPGYDQYADDDLDDDETETETEVEVEQHADEPEAEPEATEFMVGGDEAAAAPESEQEPAGAGVADSGLLTGGDEAARAEPEVQPESDIVDDDEVGYGVKLPGLGSNLAQRSVLAQQEHLAGAQQDQAAQSDQATEQVEQAEPESGSSGSGLAVPFTPQDQIRPDESSQWAKARKQLLQARKKGPSPAMIEAMERDRSKHMVTQPRMVVLHHQRQARLEAERKAAEQARLDELAGQMAAVTEMLAQQARIGQGEDATEQAGDEPEPTDAKAPAQPDQPTDGQGAQAAEPADTPEEAEVTAEQQPVPVTSEEPEPEPDAWQSDVEPEPKSRREYEMSTTKITDMLSGLAELSELEREFFLTRADLVSATMHNTEIARLQEMAMVTAGQYESESIRLRESLGALRRVNSALQVRVTELQGGGSATGLAPGEHPEPVEPVLQPCGDCEELTRQLAAARDELAQLAAQVVELEHELALAQAGLARATQPEDHAEEPDVSGDETEVPPAETDPVDVADDQVVPEPTDPTGSDVTVQDEDSDDDDSGEGGTNRELSKGADDLGDADQSGTGQGRDDAGFEVETEDAAGAESDEQVRAERQDIEQVRVHRDLNEEEEESGSGSDSSGGGVATGEAETETQEPAGDSDAADAGGEPDQDLGYSPPGLGSLTAQVDASDPATGDGAATWAADQELGESR